MKRVFILASERSGTNLLRTLLNNHRDLSAPVAPHFFDVFKRLFTKYIDPSDPDDIRKMMIQMVSLANHKFNDWKLEVVVDDLIEKYNISSLEIALDALYREKMKADGKSNYASKDNNLHLYLDELSNLENDMYLYLYRNPLDHVASWMRTPIFMFTPFDIASKWKREQKAILNINKDKKKVYYVAYEKLIANPIETMTGILNFLELEIDENCFQTNSNNEESGRHELWKNLSKPIIKTNKNKYKKYLGKMDVKIVESICKEEMKSLGYSFVSKANWKPWKGYGRFLKLKRKIYKGRRQKFINNDMAILQDKLVLIQQIRKELAND